MESIVVVGGGGHAKVIISILKKIGQYRIVGYTDSNNLGPILGVSYSGNDHILEQLYKDHKVKSAVIGIGQIDNSQERRKLAGLLKEIGFCIPSIVSPQAVINEDVTIAEGTVLMDGAVINSGTRIGSFCIVNTNASVDHDSQIGDFVHIAPGSVICGGVKVGNNSLIGTGASVIQNRSIASDCVVGAGSVIVVDINQAGTYAGNPAVKING